MARVAIALGSNIPPRRNHLHCAMEEFEAEAQIEVLNRSRIYETPPVGGPPQSLFLNAAAWVRTPLPPMALLSRLLAMEKKMGRVRTERDGPRIIDLDIILYENRLQSHPHIELPHPRFRERGFVLCPLHDIIPHFVDPLTGLTVAALLDEWKASGGELFPITGPL